MAARSRATVSSRGGLGGGSRFGFGGGYQVGGFGPDPRGEEQAQRGAQALFHQEQERRQDQRQALEEQRHAEREARLQAHEEKMEELRHAEFMRKEAEQSALVERKLAVEKEAAEVLPQMLRMDPTRPEAREFMASMMEKHPNLFISGFAKESITPQIMAFQKEVDAAAKARGIEDASTKKLAAAEAKVAAEVGKGGVVDSMTVGGQHIKTAAGIKAAQDAATAKAATPTKAAADRHARAIQELDTAQGNLESTQDQIKAREKELEDRPKSKDGPYSPAILKDKQGELQALKISEAKLIGDIQHHQDTKEYLEAAHPSLAAQLEEEGDGLPSEDFKSKNLGATAAAAQEPVNPNVVPPAEQSPPLTGEGDGLAPEEFSANAGALPPPTTGPEAPATAITPTGGITFKDPDGVRPGGTLVTMGREQAQNHLDALRQSAMTDPSAELQERIKAAQDALGNPPTDAAPADEQGPHPFEGKRKFQKSTGKWGTFVNGQFVPE